ncbi:hypothetical protein CDD82_3659 [Ophiocordyceps australis]|uniref:Uncharacterized protein n=1 Tax=Ophiocordyceps australis TaxID=1399860 RepID=A0A2C5XN79_9HYPO|nr:hypothetical protein CDD82_3659 [Ophiocordyceps australis]
MPPPPPPSPPPPPHNARQPWALAPSPPTACSARLIAMASPTSLPPIHKLAPCSTDARASAKVAIITGANSPMGIGRATAFLYAESGARAVYICDVDDSHLDAQARDLQHAFPRVDIHVRRFDATDEDKIKAVVADALDRYARLDVFFANAGITGKTASFQNTSPSEFMSVIKTNALSVFLAAKHAAPAMKKTGPQKPKPAGSIIATASVAGMRSNAGPPVYSASKAAVISLVQTIAWQLSGTGVRINALCPGLIETGMTEPLYTAARARGTTAKIGQLNPCQRGGHADEIARVALFLGSDESSYVNGQAWAIDGGLSAGMPFAPTKLA